MRIIKNLFKTIGVLLIVIMVLYSIRWLIMRAYPLEHEDYIRSYSQEFNIDPYMVMAVIKTESNYKLNAKSNKNAHGLMQITEDTGKWIATKMNMTDFKKDMLYEPKSNIRMGCWYLAFLRGQFGNNANLILAGYNGGPARVQEWLKDSRYSQDGKNLKTIPYKETRSYLKKVKINYTIYKIMYGNELSKKMK